MFLPMAEEKEEVEGVWHDAEIAYAITPTPSSVDRT